VNVGLARKFTLIAVLDQRSDQAQEFLFLWPVAGRDEKGSDLNIGDLSTRGKIGRMPDEHPTGIGIAGEQPPVPVGTEINLSGPNRHAELAPCSTPTI
jgi:hypothetical protein